MGTKQSNSNLKLFRFEDSDFRSAVARAEEFVKKGRSYSAVVYEDDTALIMVKWDKKLKEIVYILTSHGKKKGFDIVEAK
jgi:hypothetical protein